MNKIYLKKGHLSTLSKYVIINVKAGLVKYICILWTVFFLVFFSSASTVYVFVVLTTQNECTKICMLTSGYINYACILWSLGCRFINLQVSSLTDKWYGESQKLAAAVFSLVRITMSNLYMYALQNDVKI